MKTRRLFFLIAALLVLLCSCGTVPTDEPTSDEAETYSAVFVTEEVTTEPASNSETESSSEPQAKAVTTAASTTAVTTTKAPSTETTTAHATAAEKTTANAAAATQRRIAAPTTAAHTEPRTAAPTTRKAVPTTAERKTPPAPTTAAPTTAHVTTTAPTTVPVNTVTVSIDCSQILENMSKLRKNKSSFVPADGVILAKTSCEIEDGATVFDALKDVCENNEIDLEYTFSPVFDTYYIEGIAQLYEKDCGSMSGWIYKVNGVMPDVGASAYGIEPGDEIEWIFSVKQP